MLAICMHNFFFHLFWLCKWLFWVYIWNYFKNPMLGNRKKNLNLKWLHGAFTCMYAFMQMIQNTSIIIIESTFLFTYRSFLCYLVRCKKNPQIACQIALEQTSPYFFFYNVYSTEMGMQKKYYICRKLY